MISASMTCAATFGGMGGGLLEWRLQTRRAFRRLDVDNRRLRSPGPARRLLVQRSEHGPPRTAWDTPPTPRSTSMGSVLGGPSRALSMTEYRLEAAPDDSRRPGGSHAAAYCTSLPPTDS